MEIWLVSFIGGFVGSVFMDFTETRMAKLGMRSGVTGAYIGRWVKGCIKGKFMHENITHAAPEKNEVRIGQAFHFVIGGGVVALFYPFLLHVFEFWAYANHLILAVAFGLVTSVLPWFVLMPAFGWGFLGSKSPDGTRPIISPVLSHITYGLGIGLTLIAYYAIVV